MTPSWKWQKQDTQLTGTAQVLKDAMADNVSGCYCSDERWLCDRCLEHCAEAVFQHVRPKPPTATPPDFVANIGDGIATAHWHNYRALVWSLTVEQLRDALLQEAELRHSLTLRSQEMSTLLLRAVGYLDPESVLFKEIAAVLHKGVFA